jgi:predicted nucleic acid-binding protein
VTLIVDAAPLIALADRNDEMFDAVRRLLENEPGFLILPAPVAAEVDYLLSKRLGREARRGFLRDIAEGRFAVECLDTFEYDLAQRLDDTYADLNVGLADLSVVVLAHRFNTTRIATFDQRHFRALRPIGGGSFSLHPFDA